MRHLGSVMKKAAWGWVTAGIVELGRGWVSLEKRELVMGVIVSPDFHFTSRVLLILSEYTVGVIRMKSCGARHVTVLPSTMDVVLLSFDMIEGTRQLYRVFQEMEKHLIRNLVS